LIAPEGAVSRFAATFLLGAALALATNVVSAALDGLHVRHFARRAADVMLGTALLGAGLLGLEWVNHLSVRYYVLIALAGGAGLYAGLAAPVVGPGVRAISSFPTRTLRGTGRRGRGRSRA